MRIEVDGTISSTSHPNVSVYKHPYEVGYYAINFPEFSEYPTVLVTTEEIYGYGTATTAKVTARTSKLCGISTHRNGTKASVALNVMIMGQID